MRGGHRNGHGAAGPLTLAPGKHLPPLPAGARCQVYQVYQVSGVRCVRWVRRSLARPGVWLMVRSGSQGVKALFFKTPSV